MATKINFWSLLKDFKIERIIFGFDLIISLLLTILIYIAWYRYNMITFSKDIFMTLMQVSAGLFGLLFGAFAIVIAMSDEKFVVFLKKVKVFNNLMFPFWYVSILYLISIIIDLFVIITYDKGGVFYLHDLLVIIATFFTVYSLLSTFYRISATVKFGMYRSEFVVMPKEETANK